MRPKNGWLRIVFMIVLGWLVLTFGRAFWHHFQLRQEIASLHSQIQTDNMRNEQLRLEIERLRSPEYVERVAREELGLVKPGETLYILSEPMPHGAGVSVEKRSEPPQTTD